MIALLNKLNPLRLFTTLIALLKGLEPEKLPRSDGESRPGDPAQLWEDTSFAKLLEHLRLMLGLIPELEARTWMGTQLGELVAVKVSAQEVLEELEKIWSNFVRERCADYHLLVKGGLYSYDLEMLLVRVALAELADRGLFERLERAFTAGKEFALDDVSRVEMMTLEPRVVEAGGLYSDTVSKLTVLKARTDRESVLDKLGDEFRRIVERIGDPGSDSRRLYQRIRNCLSGICRAVGRGNHRSPRGRLERSDLHCARNGVASTPGTRL